MSALMKASESYLMVSSDIRCFDDEVAHKLHPGSRGIEPFVRKHIQVLEHNNSYQKSSKVVGYLIEKLLMSESRFEMSMTSCPRAGCSHTSIPSLCGNAVLGRGE